MRVNIVTLVDAEAETKAKAHVRCAKCGHAIAGDAWSQLRLERTLTLADLEAHVDVSAWPEGVVVEVRGCAKCETLLARNIRGGKLCSTQ